jgi:selenium metabolism protein YedF
MRIVNTKGQLCPAPLIATKRTLREVAEGEEFVVITDNLTSYRNLCRFLSDNKTIYKVTEKDGVWELIVSKSSGELLHPDENEYCSPDVPHFEKGNFVIVFSSDKMGDGDESLGSLLILNFIKALKDLDKLPEKLIFYNGGVKLARNESPVVDFLKELETMGVELLFCATCVNHYKLESEITFGTLSNMFTIAEILSKAGKIIKP